MKESKIKEIKQIRPWTGDRGTTYYFTVELENGDKGEVGKKTERALKVGDLLKYTLETNSRGYSQIKEFRPPNSFTPRKAESNGSLALTAAKDLAAAYVAKCDVPIEKMDALADRVIATADKFKTWLDANQ